MSRQIALPFGIDAFGRIGHTENLAKILADNIVAIVGTQPGHRLMRPDYGVDLESYLFAPITEHVRERLIVEIEQAVSLYEPRVSITGVEDISDPGGGLLGVNIHFTFVVATNNSSQTYTATVLAGGAVTA